MTLGQPAATVRELKSTFSPVFEDQSFLLSVPKLDDTVERQLSSNRNSKYIMQRENVFKSMQYQVLDFVKPLLLLMGMMSSDTTHPAFQLLESTMRLWAVAQFSITKNRRANIMSGVFPKYTALLKDPTRFSPSEIGFLFGPTFLSTLLQAIEDDKKLAQAAKQASSSSDRRRSERVAKQQQQQQQQPQSHKQASTSGEQQSKPYQSKRYSLSPTLSKVSHIIPSVSSIPKVGARLLKFAPEWRKITGDPWVLNTVSSGFRIDFLSRPRQTCKPLEGGLSDVMISICDEEVDDLLLKGAIVRVLDSSPGFYSRLFAVPKPRSTLFRPIINLKPVNSCVKYEHFKMEGLDSVKHLLRQGDWMVKLDLKDAYFTVPICEEHQCFLRFVWKGLKFQFVCLPFGLSSAPRAFTKIMKPVVAVLRASGIRVVIYLDDLLFLNSTEQGVAKDLGTAVELLERLGFIINWPKSSIIPSQIMQYLGMVINSREMTFSLPEDSLVRMQEMCRRALGHDRVRIRDLASIMGNFSWAILAIPFAQSHYRSVQQSFIGALSANGRDFDGFVSLSGRARTELEWWVSSAESVNGRPFFPFEPDLTIFSDASLGGWGASCNGVTTRGPWTSADQDRHINELELLAAFYSLQSFAPSSTDISICLQLDNRTAVAYINKCGGTRSRNLTKVSNLICHWCEYRRISVQAVYLPGSLNIIADRESRSRADSSDWKLSPRQFTLLNNLWPSEVDLFASHWNAQVPLFYSWRPQPGAVGLDAFSINWKDLKAYAFPPFGIISRCLGKIKREEATLTIITPYWPSCSWFPLLLEMSSDVARVLQPEENLLCSPLGVQHPLCLQGQLILIAWRLCGNAGDSEGFRRKWSTYCWQGRATPRTLLTSQPGRIGTVGAFNGISIPCLLA